MGGYLNKLAMACLLLTSSCAQHLPSLSVTGFSSTEGSGPPRVTDITNQVECELSQIVYSTSDPDRNARSPYNPYFSLRDQKISSLDNLTQGDSRDINILKGTSYGPQEMATLVKYLTRYHFVASVNLTLDVTDTEGLNPSLSFITPFNQMALKGNSFTMGLGGQFSGTQDRKMTIAYPIDLASLKRPQEYCAGQHVLPDLQALGIDSGLRGNLGLADIVADGMVSLDTTASYSYYGSGGNGAVTPTVFQSLDIKSDPTYKPGYHYKKIGLQEFDGYIAFGPPSQTGSPLRSVTLNGIWYFADNQQCNGILTGSTLIDRAIPPQYRPLLPVEFFATGPMSWLPSSDTDMTSSVTKDTVNLCDGKTNAIVKGQVDRDYFTGRLPDGTWAPKSKSMTLSFYTNGLKGLPTTASAAVVTDELVYAMQLAPSVPAAPAASNNSGTQLSAPQLVQNEISTLDQLQNAPIPASSVQQVQSLKLPAAPTSPQTQGSGAGSTSTGATNGPPGTSSSSAPAGTGTSFGSTVDFTVVYGLNGGPTWSLTHFKGPAGSAALLSVGRQAVDTLNITFVPACQNAEDVPAEVSSYWDSIAPCNASSFANAAAIGQGYNTTQQIAPSQ
jgi:hypothetical protein